jgi:D-tyrosyl-tRNA(Tyr) deacylase
MARVVAQRVRSASVSVDGEIVGSIGSGLAVLVGIKQGDDERAVERLADKVGAMRVFADSEGKMNLCAADVGGEMLVVSQFTLYGDLKRGRRPSFVSAADPSEGDRLYRHFMQRLAHQGYRVAAGRFGEHMLVRLENDGPVTIILDSEEL